MVNSWNKCLINPLIHFGGCFSRFLESVHSASRIAKLWNWYEITQPQVPFSTEAGLTLNIEIFHEHDNQIGSCNSLMMMIVFMRMMTDKQHSLTMQCQPEVEAQGTPLQSGPRKGGDHKTFKLYLMCTWKVMWNQSCLAQSFSGRWDGCVLTLDWSH